MPEFEENKGYKMKGSEFYGHGNSTRTSNSPAKVSDEMVVKSQQKLDHTELDFREPGWAKAARGAHEGFKKVAGSVVGMAAGGAAGGEGAGDAASSVSEIMKQMNQE